MNEPSMLFTVCMGVGTVFVGLLCLVILCRLMSLACGDKKTPVSTALPETAPTVIENRAEIIAAVSAAAAEDMGTDVSAIRILSFKKL